MVGSQATPNDSKEKVALRFPMLAASLGITGSTMLRQENKHLHSRADKEEFCWLAETLLKLQAS